LAFLALGPSIQDAKRRPIGRRFFSEASEWKRGVVADPLLLRGLPVHLQIAALHGIERSHVDSSGAMESCSSRRNGADEIAR